MGPSIPPILVSFHLRWFSTCMKKGREDWISKPPLSLQHRKSESDAFLSMRSLRARKSQKCLSGQHHSWQQEYHRISTQLASSLSAGAMIYIMIYILQASTVDISRHQTSSTLPGYGLHSGYAQRRVRVVVGLTDGSSGACRFTPPRRRNEKKGTGQQANNRQTTSIMQKVRCMITQYNSAYISIVMSYYRI